MKITQKQLKQIIKEETNAVILEMRGPLRKLFRMENPNLNKYIDAFVKAMRDVKRRYEDLQDTGSDEQYGKLVKDLDDAQDAPAIGSSPRTSKPTAAPRKSAKKPANDQDTHIAHKHLPVNAAAPMINLASATKIAALPLILLA